MSHDYPIERAKRALASFFQSSFIASTFGSMIARLEAERINDKREILDKDKELYEHKDYANNGKRDYHPTDAVLRLISKHRHTYRALQYMDRKTYQILEAYYGNPRYYSAQVENLFKDLTALVPMTPTFQEFKGSRTSYDAILHLAQVSQKLRPVQDAARQEAKDLLREAVQAFSEVYETTPKEV